MTVIDVQKQAAAFAERTGNRPKAVVSNRKTHDAITVALGKPKLQMSKWRIDDGLADDVLGFDA